MSKSLVCFLSFFQYCLAVEMSAIRGRANTREKTHIHTLTTGKQRPHYKYCGLDRDYYLNGTANRCLKTSMEGARATSVGSPFHSRTARGKKEPACMAVAAHIGMYL